MYNPETKTEWVLLEKYGVEAAQKHNGRYYKTPDPLLGTNVVRKAVALRLIPTIEGYGREDTEYYGVLPSGREIYIGCQYTYHIEE